MKCQRIELIVGVCMCVSIIDFQCACVCMNCVCVHLLQPVHIISLCVHCNIMCSDPTTMCIGCQGIIATYSSLGLSLQYACLLFH